MRLFYVDKAECEHISDITKRVQKIYQLEAELEPYLIVDFWPNKTGAKPNFTLVAGREVIEQDIDLDNEAEFESLRSLLWHYLKKYHDVYDVTETCCNSCSKAGKCQTCMKNMNILQKNNVIQGWQNKLRNLRGNRNDTDNTCCKNTHIKPKRNIVQEWAYRTNNNNYKENPMCQVVRDMVADGFMEFIVKHEVYKNVGADRIDRNLCKKIRWGECNDNYPVGTAQHQICVKEVDWLCNQGYSSSKGDEINIKDKIVQDTRKRIYDYLNKNNLKVNKAMFDDIITAGLFDDLGNRMGNKSTNIMHIRDNVDNLMREKDYYLQLVENFDGTDTETKKSDKNVAYGVFWIVVFLLMIVVLYKMY